MAANFGSDPWLDARMRNVPLPVGMLGRLSQIGNPADEQLDAAIRDVPLPEGLLERLAQISALPRRRITARRLALAASLLLAVGLGCLAIAARTGGPQPNTEETASLVAQQDPLTEEDTAARGTEATAFAQGEDLGIESPDAAEPAPEAPESLLSGFDPAVLPSPQIRPLPLPGPRARRARPLFGSDGAIDRLPALETVSRPADRGLAPPLVAAYDLLQHLKTGERSFASPAADPLLASTLIPLAHDTTSFRLADRALGEGRLPAPDEVRIEDFLAALGDQYPPAESPLVIRVEAGPAPLGEPGLKLLQVGLQAGRPADPARPAIDLTIAVDTSASMRHGRRLDMVRKALRQVAAELTPADRLTLIGFSDYAELLLDGWRPETSAATVPTGTLQTGALQTGTSPAGSPQVGAQPGAAPKVAAQAVADVAGAPAGDVSTGDGARRAATERLLAAIDALEPASATNVGAGIELAASTIRRAGSEPGRGRRLLLLSDGLAELGPDVTARISEILQSLAAESVKFDVVDVSGDREISAPLAELARAGGGSALRAGDREEMRSVLSDSLAGGPQIVARSVSLKVTFNPEVVHSYRLVGHATPTITGSASAATQVDIRAGAQAAGLFEVWLRPGGGDNVAVAELTWLDPASRAPHQLSQRISRLQFAKSFAESPLPLEAAAIAAEAARALRSRGGASGRSFARVLELAAQAHPRLDESDSLRQLVEMIARAEKLRAGGTTVRRAPGGPKL